MQRRNLRPSWRLQLSKIPGPSGNPFSPLCLIRIPMLRWNTRILSLPHSFQFLRYLHTGNFLGSTLLSTMGFVEGPDLLTRFHVSASLLWESLISFWLRFTSTNLRWYQWSICCMLGCCFVFDTGSLDGDHELCWGVATPGSKTIACGSVASLGSFVTNKPSKRSNTIICPKVSIPGGSVAEQPSRFFKDKSNLPLFWEFLLGCRVPCL